jgi:hypothetical protein
MSYESPHKENLSILACCPRSNLPETLSRPWLAPEMKIVAIFMHRHESDFRRRDDQTFDTYKEMVMPLSQPILQQGNPDLFSSRAIQPLYRHSATRTTAIMYTINKVVLATAAFALLATAIPAEPRDLYVREATASVACGNGQVISCCDKSTSNTDSGDTDGGLLGVGNVANGLLGGACTPLGVGGRSFPRVIFFGRRRSILILVQSLEPVSPSTKPAVTTSQRVARAIRAYVATFTSPSRRDNAD